MATWIKTTNGKRETVTPANGKRFTLAELQSMVGGYIEPVRLGDDLIMWVNEEGILKGLPFNWEATVTAAFWARNYWARTWTDAVVGDVVIATRAESGEDEEDDFDWASNDTD